MPSSKKQGKRIPYRTVSILPAGLHIDEKQAAAFLDERCGGSGLLAKRSKGRALPRKTADTAAQSPSQARKDSLRLPSRQNGRLAWSRHCVPGV